MRKRVLLVITILLAALILTAQAASASGRGPANPERQEVMALEAAINAKLAVKDATPDGYVSNAWLTGVSFTTVQAPSLTQTGIFQVSIAQNLIDQHGAVTDMSVSLRAPDATGFTTMYRFRNVSETIETCTFTAPGSYQLAVFYTLADNEQYAGIKDFTIAEDGVHPTVDQKIQQILGECRVAGNDWQTALNIHDWLTHHAYYDNSYSFYGAEGVLTRGYGVCDSYSKAYQMLLNAAGITNRRVTSKTHAWNVIQLDGTEYHIDVTWDDPAGDETAVSGWEGYDYFCINDELIYGFLDDSDRTHQIGASYTGHCSSLTESYPIHTGEWRNYGQYCESSSVKNLSDLIIEMAYDGNRTFEVPGNQDYPAGSDGIIYPFGGSNDFILCKRYFFAFGLNQAGLSIDGGVLDADVTYNTSDYYFTVTINGWKMAETGTLQLPEDLTEIQDYAFMGTDATTAIVPSSCTAIGIGAFQNSSLRWIEIPNVLTSVGNDAFSGCSPLIIVAPDNSAAAAYADANNILRFHP